MIRLILPITLLFFAVSLYFSYFVPSFNKINILNEDINRATNTLNVQKKQIEERLIELKGQINSIDSKDIEKLNRLLPQQEDFNEAEFINEINDIAAKHGMAVEGVQFSSNQSNLANKEINGSIEYYGTFKMNFNITGTYRKFVDFMKDIERSEQLTDVDISSFQSNQTENEDSYKYSVSITTYWLN